MIDERPTSRSRRRTARLWLLVSLLSLGACTHSSIQPYEVIDCRCKNGICPDNRCNVQIALTPSCEGRLTEAEVLLGSYLEQQTVKPGARYETCFSLAPGEKVTILVRGDEWEWGPTEETCGTPNLGRSIQLTLDCCECVADSDCVRIGKGTRCQPDCLCGE